MEVKVKLRYLRIAPRKVRLVADLIRRKSVEEAQNTLNFTVKKAAQPILKLLNQAIIDAKHNFQLDKSNLYIKKITVDEGPKYKRMIPRARGQAAEIQKKTSHITIVLDEISQKPSKKTGKKEKPKVERKQKIFATKTK
jgi:large subunit ribosomal protein L22